LTDLFKSRIENIKNILSSENLSNLLILSDENIYYLTGFYGKNSGSLLLITDNKLHLITNFLYLEQAKKSIDNDSLNIVFYRRDRFKKLLEILEGYNFESVNLEGKNISFKDGLNLGKMLSRQNKEFKIKDGLVEKLRIIKDEVEISKIKNACKITDNAFNKILDYGAKKVESLSEVELSFSLEELMVKNNSIGKSFDIIVAYDKNSSMPHYSPQKIKVKDGIVLMDFGCRYTNYCSDMTRTIFTRNNKICNEFKKIYDIVLEAQYKAIKFCREGITCRELDSTARNFISSKGYGNNFGHGLGHGVGLEIHEEPIVNPESNTVLKENMIITVEPGIYIEDFGGVRIEDMLLVKKNACEVLYGSTKEFFIMADF